MDLESLQELCQTISECAGILNNLNDLSIKKLTVKVNTGDDEYGRLDDYEFEIEDPIVLMVVLAAIKNGIESKLLILHENVKTFPRERSGAV